MALSSFNAKVLDPASSSSSRQAVDSSGMTITLPMNLIRRICIMAVEEEYRCGPSLALTCKDISQCTAEARWRVVVITSIPQLLAFCRVVHAIPACVYDRLLINLSKRSEMFRSCAEGRQLLPYSQDVWCWSDCDSDSEARISARRKRRGLTRSLPLEGDLHSAVQHLFIDLEGKEGTHYSSFNLPSCGEGGVFPWYLLQDDLTPDEFDHLSKVVGGLFDPFKGSGNLLEHLSLGRHAHRLLDGQYGAKEFTFVKTLERLTEQEAKPLISYAGGYQTFLPNSAYFPDISLPFPAWNGSSVQRVHYINMNFYDQKTQMPICLAHELEGLDRPSHFRLDTLRSSLLPLVEFVYQLAHSLVEPTIHPSFLSAKSSSNADATISQAQWMAYRGEKGWGRLQFIQLAWNPETPSIAPSCGGPMELIQEESIVESIDVGGSCCLWSSPEDSNVPVEESQSEMNRWRQETVTWDPDAPLFRPFGSAWNHRRVMALHRSRLKNPKAYEEEASPTENDSDDSFLLALKERIKTECSWEAQSGIKCAWHNAQSLTEGMRANETYFSVVPSGIAAILARQESLGGVMDAEEIERRKAWQSNVILKPVSVGKLAQHIQHRRDGNLAKWEEEIATRCGVCPVMQYRMRAPGNLVHFGGKAAFSREERLRLFEDRARGGKGAWP